MDASQLFARKQLLEMHREKLGLSAKKTAHLCGITETEYVAYEEGRIEEHEDIDLEELLYYFKSQEKHLLIEGDPRVRQDRFEK